MVFTIDEIVGKSSRQIGGVSFEEALNETS